MNNRVLAEAEEHGSWDIRVKAGTGRIKDVWARLQPETKHLLQQDGFNGRGTRDTPLDIGDYSSDLAYSLGVFAEAAKANIPMNYGDSIPSCYLGDEVLHQAVNLVLDRRYCDPEFTSLALHACMKHQTAGAVSSFYFNGGKHSRAKSWPRLIGLLVVVILLSVLLAASIGNGLVAAVEHDAATSAGLVLVALFSYGTLKNLSKPDEVSRWDEAFTSWSSLINRDFHVGTGHGVERQLQQFLSKGVHVPSVLFDLCAMLQQGTGYVRETQVKGENAHAH